MGKGKRGMILVLLGALAAFVGLACREVDFHIEFINEGQLYREIDGKSVDVLALPEDPEKEGFVFDGWFFDDDTFRERFTLAGLAEKPVSFRFRVYAKWATPELAREKLRIDGFERNGDTFFGSAAEDRETLDLRGKIQTFGCKSYFLAEDKSGSKKIETGIVTLGEGRTTVYLAFTPLSGEVQVFELVIERAERFTVSFDSAGGTPCQTQHILPGGLATPPVTTREGYVFDGWDYDFAEPVTGNLTVTAKWKIDGYFVVYDAGGGSGEMGEQAVFSGKGFTPAHCAFTRAGYAFAGWRFGGKIYPAGGKISEELAPSGEKITFTAQWTANEIRLKFDAGGGAGSMADLVVQYDETFTIPPCGFTRTGHTFLGWQGNGRDYAPGDSAKNLSTGGEVTLTANWTPIEYFVAFDDGQQGGGTYRQSFRYGEEKLLARPDFMKAGHTFVAWESEDGRRYQGESIVSNLADSEGEVFRLTAIWRPNTYEAQFRPNGGQGNYVYVDAVYGVPFRAPDGSGLQNPGYRFTCWSGAGGKRIEPGDTLSNLTEIDKDTVIFYAQYSPVSFTVRYDAGGGTGSMEDQTMTIDTSDRLRMNAFVREGYTFGGFRLDGKLYAEGAYQPNSPSTALSVREGEVVTLTAVWVYRYAGEGTEGSPYRIETPAAFLALGDAAFVDEGYLTKHYALTSDLDLGGAVLSPLGGILQGKAFTGALEGGGFTVSNFTLDGNGLVAENRGRIASLGLGGVRLLAGQEYAGLFAGVNYGFIEDCRAADVEVTGGRAKAVGGIVGLHAGGMVRDCSFSGRMEVETDQYMRVGGIAGANTSVIFGCSVQADIAAKAVDYCWVGGIVGDNTWYTSFYGQGTVASCDFVGSLSVSGRASVQCGPVVGHESAAGFGKVEKSFFGDTSEFCVLAGESESGKSNDVGTATAAANLDDAGWRAQNLFGGAAERVEISTREQLLALSGGSLYGDYVLAADIDLAGAGWNPSLLYGNFDGGGHRISNAVVTAEGAGQTGFFSCNYGTIQRLTLDGFRVRASGYTNLYCGGLAGFNSGTIIYCSVSADVEVSGMGEVVYAGGIAGASAGVIRFSHARVNLTAENGDGSAVAGGIAAAAKVGVVENCYSEGEIAVTASGIHSTTAGGIVALNGDNNGNNNTVRGCFSLANFTVTGYGYYRNVYPVAYGAASSYASTAQKITAIYDGSSTVSYPSSGWYVVPAARFLEGAFLTREMGFGEYTDADGLATDPRNAWVFGTGKLPRLFFETV